MKKVKINGYLKNINSNDVYLIDNIIGKYDNNILEYIEKNDNQTKVKIILDNTLIIDRQDDLINMKLIFNLNNPQKGTYIIKDIDKKIIFDILTEKVNINNQTIYLKYEMILNDQSMGIFEYNITFKEE